MPETQQVNTTTQQCAHQFTNLEILGRQKRDFSLVLMAMELNEECHAPKVEDTLRYALKWLQKKKETTPTHPFFHWHENIHAFLDCFPSEILATINLVFIDDESEWLLQAMQDYPLLNKICISDPRCLNSRFSSFLEHAKHLTQIHLELANPLCLGSELIALIYGLDKNTSLEKVDLKGQLKDADRLVYLLETINNSQNIRCLDLRGCELSETCHQTIRAHRQNNKTVDILFDFHNHNATTECPSVLNCTSSTHTPPAFIPHYSRHITNFGMPFSPEIIAQADAEIAAITKRMAILF